MMLLPLQGVPRRCTIPQGVALGYVLLPLQGEALNTELWRYGGKYYVFEDTESFFRTPWLCPAFPSALSFPSALYG